MTFRMASTNRWLSLNVFEKSVILKKIAIFSKVRSVVLKIVRRVDLFEPAKFMIISILLLFSWSLNIRQNENYSFTFIY